MFFPLSFKILDKILYSVLYLIPRPSEFFYDFLELAGKNWTET